MVMSDSVLAALAPHLQQMLNPQAEALPLETEGEVVKSAGAVAGGGVTDADAAAAPVREVASDDRAD